jgi:hypothetical protein
LATRLEHHKFAHSRHNILKLTTEDWDVTSDHRHNELVTDFSPSHGKDNKLIVWKLSEEDEASMSVILPVDTSPEPRKQPWVLHILHVNTMNFCSFAQTDAKASSGSDLETEDELLMAVPNTMSSETVSSFP